jgi:hypothetical protein
LGQVVKKVQHFWIRQSVFPHQHHAFSFGACDSAHPAEAHSVVPRRPGRPWPEVHQRHYEVPGRRDACKVWEGDDSDPVGRAESPQQQNGLDCGIFV